MNVPNSLPSPWKAETIAGRLCQGELETVQFLPFPGRSAGLHPITHLLGCIETISSCTQTAIPCHVGHREANSLGRCVAAPQPGASQHMCEFGPYGADSHAVAALSARQQHGTVAAGGDATGGGWRRWWQQQQQHSSTGRLEAAAAGAGLSAGEARPPLVPIVLACLSPPPPLRRQSCPPTPRVTTCHACRRQRAPRPRPRRPA